MTTLSIAIRTTIASGLVALSLVCGARATVQADWPVSEHGYWHAYRAVLRPHEAYAFQVGNAADNPLPCNEWIMMKLDVWQGPPIQVRITNWHRQTFTYPATRHSSTISSDLVRRDGQITFTLINRSNRTARLSYQLQSWWMPSVSINYGPDGCGT